ncbi:hypothetical protein JCM10207_005335 [Rhodosporidiobolus poonsookiae]
MAQQVQTVDDYVALVAGLGSDDLEKTLLPVIKKLDKSTDAPPQRPSATSTRARGDAASSSTPAAGAHLLTGKMKDGQDPLDVLSPSQHTVGYLYLLNTRLAAANPDFNVLFQKAQTFAEQFDAREARKVYLLVLHFAESLVGLSHSLNQPALAIPSLKALVQRYPHAGYLTHLHPLFLNQVLVSGSYPSALEVLQQDITDVDKVFYPIKYQDHLLYHYLGGTILALLGDYVRAADLLEIAVSAPGPSASLIQIDAYKKLVLVQLLAHGKVQPLPKYTSQAVQQAVKVLGAAYNEYAAAFVSLDRAKVAQVKDKGKDTFEKDLNLGLILTCESSLRRRQILKLTDTYMTLPLGEIAAYVGHDPTVDAQLDEVEQEIASMAATKQIFVTLLPPPSGQPKSTTVVTFADDPEPYTSRETVERVTRAIQGAQALERSWAAEAERLGESKEFVQKAWTAAGNTSASAGAGFGGMTGGFGDEFDYGSTPSGLPGGFGDDPIEMDSD